MPTSAAARTGITRWSAEADPFNRTQTDADHALLDDLVAIDLHDAALLARPAVGIRGRYFTESAASAGLPGTTWREDGVAWRAVGSRVLSQSSTDIAQIVAGVTGQTADLQQWRAGASTLGRVDNTGQLFAVGAQLGPSPQTALPAMLGVTPASSAAIGAIIRAAVSQTADLQQWRDSGSNVTAKVDKAGSFTSVGTGGTAGFLLIDSGSGLAAAPNSRATLYGRYGVEVRAPLAGGLPTPNTGATTDPALTVISAVAANPALAVWGAPSQTGDLQQWRSSAGTVLAKVDASGQLQATTGIFAPATSNIALAVKGASGQTSDLQEWQNNAGTALSAIPPGGGFWTSQALTALNGASIGTSNAWGMLSVTTGAAVNVVAALRGAPSQSADLQQWQTNAGTVVASVQPSGQGTFAGLQSMGANNFNQPTTQVSPSAAAIPYTIRAAAAQTADLTEWLSNAGSLIAVIRPDGSAIFKSGASDNTLAGSFGGALGVNSNRLSSAMLSVVADAAASRGAIIRGAASQSANLTEWQDSSAAIKAFVRNDGQIQSNTGVVVNGQPVSGGVGAALGVVLTATNQPGVIVKGAVSQSARLQEWQNSAGTAMLMVRADGLFGDDAGANYMNAPVGASFRSSVRAGTGQVGMSIEGTSGGDIVQFYSAGVEKSWITAAGTYTTSSRQLKRNIRDLDHGLAAIRALRPVRFAWRTGPQDDQLGFISEEVVGVMPEVIGFAQRGHGYAGVNYIGMLPAVVKAIQELSDRVDALAA